ncbi:MAG: FmdB family zinc ribbon protein [Thermoanaerobaculia bacterium]
MPLYEYQCQECGEVSEVLQRTADAPFTICSSCGGALKKLISAPAIQFKGSGFYITDYGKGNGKRASSESAKSESSGESAKSKTAGSEGGSGSSSSKS